MTTTPTPLERLERFIEVYKLQHGEERGDTLVDAHTPIEAGSLRLSDLEAMLLCFSNEQATNASLRRALEEPAIDVVELVMKKHNLVSGTYAVNSTELLRRSAACIRSFCLDCIGEIDRALLNEIDAALTSAGTVGSNPAPGTSDVPLTVYRPPITFEQMKAELGKVEGEISVYVLIDGVKQPALSATILDHPLSGGIQPHFVLTVPDVARVVQHPELPDPTQLQSLPDYLVKSGIAPIAYLRMLDGKPDWSEDCVSEDAHSLSSTFPEDEPGYSVVALYLHPAKDVAPKMNSPKEKS